MPRTDYRIVAVAYLSFIVLGMIAAVLGVLWSPHIRSTFGLELGDLGALLLTNTIGYFIASSISGRIFARFPVGLALAAAMALSALGILGYMVAPAWWFMVLSGLLLGFGTGILDGGMNIYFAAYFNARLMNWLHACFGIGTFIAPQLVNLIVLQGGQAWPAVYAVMAVLLVVLMGVYLATRQRWLPVQPEQGSAAHAPMRATLALPLVWMGIVVFICYTGMEAGTGTWAAPFFQAQNVSEFVANNWVTAYWLSFTIGRIFFGFIVTRFAARSIIRFGMVGALVGAGVLLWRPFLEANVLGVVIFGFMLSPMFALLISSTQERLGPQHAPNAIGLQVAAASLGGGALPALIGALTQSLGISALPLLLMGFTLLMAVLYELSLNPRLKVK